MSNPVPREGARRRAPRAVLVVVALFLVAGLTAIVVATTRPAGAATGFHCASQKAFPTLKAGEAGSVSTGYQHYVATFSAVGARTKFAPLPNDVPFVGHLTVTHGGERWTLPPASRGRYAGLATLCVIEFSGESQPAVLTQGYSGGAHCCFEPVLYRFDAATRAYVKVIDWTPLNYKSALKFDNNGGYRPKVVNGQVVLRTEDDAFAYTFGCFACTPMPIVLDTLRNDQLVDVTASYSALVAREAASLKSLLANQVATERRAVPANREGPFGVLAAWVADECTLGRGARAWPSVTRLQAAGLLSNTIYYDNNLEHLKGNFASTLAAFLPRYDYCRGQHLA